MNRLFRILKGLSQLLDPIEWFDECELCAADGWPGQKGHSTTSCEADRIKDPTLGERLRG